MENQSYFFRVGLFVLVILVLSIIVSVRYFGTQTIRYNQYAVLFQKDVGGLTIGSDVTLQGIKVGQVTNINLLNDDITVQVIIDVEDRFVVREDTVASLVITNISGSVKLQLENKGFSEEKLEAGPFQKIPTIPSDSSTVEQLVNQLPTLLTSLNNIVEQAEQIFSNENIANLSETLYNINKLTQNLRTQQDSFNSIIANLEVVLANTQKASDDFPHLTQNLGQTLSQLQSNLSAINNRLLPQLETAIDTSRKSLETIENLGNQLSDNPSSIIKEPQYKGYRIVE